MIVFEKSKCYCLPVNGKFVIDKAYDYSYVIDGIQVIDEENAVIYFNEMEFLWYFKEIG